PGRLVLGKAGLPPGDGSVRDAEILPDRAGCRGSGPAPGALAFGEGRAEAASGEGLEPDGLRHTLRPPGLRRVPPEAFRQAGRGPEWHLRGTVEVRLTGAD